MAMSGQVGVWGAWGSPGARKREIALAVGDDGAVETLAVIIGVEPVWLGSK